MDVSVIIVNYNTHVLLKNIVESLYEKTINVSFELIIVDNNSKIRPSDYLTSYDNGIVFIDLDENLGFGRANNEGLKVANGRNILFLNPDTILINNAIKILSDYLDSNEKVGACGGNLYDEEMSPTHSYQRMFPSVLTELADFVCPIFQKMPFLLNKEYNFSEKPIKVAYITGADLMVKKQVIDSVGGFNPNFFMYYEETELCWRIHLKHYDIISVPFAQIQHLECKRFKDKQMNEKRISFMENGRFIFYSSCYSSFYLKLVYSFIYCSVLARLCIFRFLNNHKYQYWKIRQKYINAIKLRI